MCTDANILISVSSYLLDAVIKLDAFDLLYSYRHLSNLRNFRYTIYNVFYTPHI